MGTWALRSPWQQCFWELIPGMTRWHCQSAMTLLCSLPQTPFCWEVSKIDIHSDTTQANNSTKITTVLPHRPAQIICFLLFWGAGGGEDLEGNKKLDWGSAARGTGEQCSGVGAWHDTTTGLHNSQTVLMRTCEPERVCHESVFPMHTSSCGVSRAMRPLVYPPPPTGHQPSEEQSQPPMKCATPHWCATLPPVVHGDDGSDDLGPDLQIFLSLLFSWICF